MKLQWHFALLTVLLITGTVFSLPQRSVRSIGERQVQRERGVIHPGIAEEHVDTLHYEDPDDISFFMTLPNEFNDQYYNVRFTPLHAPFQIFAIHIPLFDMFGDPGTPGMEISIWESGEQDGETGYPTNLIVTIEVPFEDLEFSGDDPVFNVIDIADLNISFNDEVDFHVAINVISDDEDDTLAIYMDDGEFVENSRSGLFLGEDEEEEFPWIRLQDIEGMLPYNYAIHAVIGEPDDDPPELDEFELDLIEGWNLVSSAVDPEDRNIQAIFADLIADSILAYIRNSAGDFFNPIAGEGQLETWEPDQAYQINMYASAMVVISGEYVDSAAEYMLSEGWNWLPYPRLDELHPAEAFEEYSESLEIAKNNSGIFWLADEGLNYMSMITPGSGVMVKVSAETEFSWAEPAGEMDLPIEINMPQYFSSPMYSGINMSLLITSWDDIIPAEGDELALMDDEGRVFGSIVVNGGTQPLVVWGDDVSTPEEVEGFLTDSSFHFTYYSNERDEEFVTYGVTAMGDIPLYSDNSFFRIVVNLTGVGVRDSREAFLHNDFRIISLFPNPFNQTSQLEFSLSAPTLVNVNLWSIDGRLLNVLSRGYYTAGIHTVNIKANDLSAGMYLLGLQSGSRRLVKPIILIP